MTRKSALLLTLLCLTACAQHYAPVEPIPTPPDLPDAALVQPCDTAETDPATVGALGAELTHTRRQRDDCSAKVDGLAKWRGDAIKRATVKPLPAAKTGKTKK